LASLKHALQGIAYRLYRAFHPSIVNIQGVLLSTRDPAISAKMFHVLSQDYEASEIALATDWIKPDDKVLELGAGVGFIGLFCILKLGVTRYAMVEANPGLVRVVARNIALNRTEPPPVLIHAAIGGADAQTTFHMMPDFWSSSTTKRGELVETISVPAKTIPTVVAQLPFEPDTLIIDIEGGETQIPLEHYASFRKVIIETHARVAGRPAIKALLRGFENLGFERRAQRGLSYVYTRDRPAP
jgi:FkbM family methyltransferase